MEARQLLHGYLDAAKPLSRLTLAKQLKSLETSVDKLSAVERETYEFLRSEFRDELVRIEDPGAVTDQRQHLLSFDVDEGVGHLDPNVQFINKNVKNESVRTLSFGAKVYGYAFQKLGLYFNFWFNRESGSARDATKQNSPETGVVVQRGMPDFFEYNSTDVQLTYQLGAVELSLEKMHNVWGYGQRSTGTVIFSEKSPSYPQIKLRIPFTSWLDFVYVHADLHSNVVDSVASYHANSSFAKDFYRTVYRPKYMAAHQFEFTPVRGVDISIGESIVYSDKGPELIYLIPLMFFKSAEHYNRDTDNAQLFGSLDLNVIRNINAYFSLLIDEIDTDIMFDPETNRNQLGFTTGLRLFDLLGPDQELVVEYSRLNPWVYSHKFPAATFTNNGYDLGHWVGQNGDDLYVEMNYRPLRPLLVGATFERYRKGGLADVADQYGGPHLPFLYGPVRKQMSYGLYGRYQFVRDGFFEAGFRSIDLQDEANPAAAGNWSELSLSIRYGL